MGVAVIISRQWEMRKAQTVQVKTQFTCLHVGLSSCFDSVEHNIIR